MPFSFQSTEIPDVVHITPRYFEDARGGFMEMFKSSDFKEIGCEIRQLNFSDSTRGVLRGLHYQLPPKPLGKLVTCIVGEIFDVGVDLRKSSPTFKRWVGRKLSAENREMLYVPVGFAHGFLVLSETAKVMYGQTDEYTPELERGVRWNDPEIGIAWPEANPILHPRDANFPSILETQDFF